MTGGGTGAGDGGRAEDGGATGIRVAIDGPAASGKSTTAKAVARELGYAHLNSGLLYRAVTWAALRGGWVDAPRDEFAARVRKLDLELLRRDGEFAVEVGGERPGSELASRAVSARVSDVAAREAVREVALEELREAGRPGGVVCDGRDIGTVVFPEAELKVFLVATAEERARRRLLDYGEEPTERGIAAEAERLR
ncbi:MAG: (d)CMP kinase, partial [Gemmatimonadota bacterium]